MTKIKWERVQKWDIEAGKLSNITYWYGRINDILFFEIYQFKNDMFEDPFVMTSNVIPFQMRQDVNLEKIQEVAQETLETFINSIARND